MPININWLRFVRWYLDKTIKLCRLNPAGELDGFGPSTKLAQVPLWSRLIELFYVYFALKLLVCQVLQHNYNVILHALKALDDDDAAGGGQAAATETNETRHANEERATKQAQLDEAAARLNLIGNGFYELGFAVEPLFVCLLIIIQLIYVQTRLFIALRGPVAFGVLQMLLDPERERALGTDRQVAHQVNKFVVSSGNFKLANRKRILGAHSKLCINHAKQLKHWRLQLFELECAHERAASEVRELARSGQLVPPNRRSECVARMARVYGLLVVGAEISSLLFVAITLFIVPWCGMLNRKPRREFSHLLFQTELVLHGLIGTQHLPFYLVNGFMSAYEQLQFVRELSRMIVELTDDTCLATATCQLAELRYSFRWPRVTVAPAAAVASGSPDWKLAQESKTSGPSLNRRLMRILILYKLLLNQMRASQPSVGFIGAHIILIMLTVPVLNRIYVAYLPTEVRWVLLVCAIAIIISTDVLVVPNCLLHARCLDLFRSMSSLLAHIDAHQAASCGRSLPKQLIYDEHTVWLLRREQNSPELALRRFATDAHFLHLTYANFIGVHFWCGLMLAPMFLRDTARPGTSGNLLTDSLRLF